MRAALLIAGKDMRQRLRDKSAILLGIVAPLGLAFIFSLIIPDFGDGDFVVRAAVVDQDGGEIALGFTEQVLPAVVESGLLEVTPVTSAAEAVAAVEDFDYEAAFIIPEGFTESVLTGGDTSIRVVGNVDAQISTQIAAAIAGDYAATLTGGQVAGAAGITLGLAPEEAGPLAVRAATAEDIVDLVESPAASKVLDATTFFTAGMAIFFLFFTVQFGVASLLEERINGTLPRLLAAPINRLAIIGGKAIASLLVGVIAMVVLAVASTLLIQADWGNPVGVGLLIVASVFAALGIMAVTATLAKTPEQSANWQSIIAVVLGMLGGTFFPISQAPGFLANLSLLTPHAWFMRGLGELHAGGGPGSVLVPVLAILAFCAVTLAIAALRIRKMVTV